MNPMSLEDARNSAQVTQAYMAEQLGVSRQTYAALERDPEKIMIGQARRICSVLGRKFEEIIFSKMFSTTNA